MHTSERQAVRSRSFSRIILDFKPSFMSNPAYLCHQELSTSLTAERQSRQAEPDE
jgi:hypothetical protein